MDVNKIQLNFIVPEKFTDENECSDDMLRAFELCKQNFANVRWTKEKNCGTIDLNKSNIIVFQSFEGKFFDSVKDSESIIVGPWCLLTCVVEGRSIPNLPWPIYCVAMSDCFIACSSVSKTVKQELKYKIRCMAGHYTDSLLANNTHLVTDSVKSEKYVKAADAKLKIMLPSWVDDVWLASSKANVNCDDKQFKKHRCLPFHGLTICSTGFTDVKERDELERLVTENSGRYTGQLHVGKTDVLICKGVTFSQKYKAARKVNHIKCVTFDWIVDSIKEGYALPENSYHVRIGTSTPTKDGETDDPNFSVVSAVSSASMMTSNLCLEETVNATLLNQPSKKRKSSSSELSEMIEGIDVKLVKQAGTFLDGCSVFLAGFTTEQREKLCKVLNFSGATRYDELSERISHIIVGDSSCHELKLLRLKRLHPPLVSIKWLLDSIEHKLPMSEENYIVVETDGPKDDSDSPLSKKSLQFLRSTETVSKHSTEMEPAEPPESDLIQHYLKDVGSTGQEDTLAKLLRSDFTVEAKEQTTTRLQNDETSSMSLTVTKDGIFENLKFSIVNFEPKEQDELKCCIESLGGEVIYGNDRDYVVVPVFETESPPNSVTDYWISECAREKELREIMYYHRPFSVEQSDVLRDCVVTISGYTQSERIFLINLCEHLGGISQEQLARVARNNIPETTHLLCCEASGKKYSAAIKWKIPVVDKDWLLECARTASFVSESKFLIGDAIAPPSRQKNVEQISSLAKLSSSSEISVQTLKADRFTVTTASETALLEQESPDRNKHTSDVNVELRTPSNRALNDAMKCSEVNTQVTPVNKIMQEMRMLHGVGTSPVTPKLKGELDDIATPDTPYGAFIRPNPSPHLRKVWLKYINNAPDYRPRRDSTPLSELKRQLWNKIGRKEDENKVATPPVVQQTADTDKGDDDVFNVEQSEESIVANNLQQLQEMLTASGGNKKITKKRLSFRTAEASATTIKDSQPCTVGWDYMDCDDEVNQAQARKENIVFMISGVEPNEREKMAKQLQDLGAVVSDLANYDPASTHLLCAKPSRNEKLMSSMAAGKWILHTSYLEHSVAAGKLLNEEEYEYGNPRAAQNIKLPSDKDTETRAEAIHWWRKEVARRGYGAFHDMRAIIVASKRDSLERVIEAGGGMVIDLSPPFDDSVYATHCLIETKMVPDMSAYVTLAKQGILCVHIFYINNFLHRTVGDVRDSVLPYFRQYYDT